MHTNATALCRGGEIMRFRSSPFSMIALSLLSFSDRRIPYHPSLYYRSLNYHFHFYRFLYHGYNLMAYFTFIFVLVRGLRALILLIFHWLSLNSIYLLIQTVSDRQTEREVRGARTLTSYPPSSLPSPSWNHWEPPRPDGADEGVPLDAFANHRTETPPPLPPHPSWKRRVERGGGRCKDTQGHMLIIMVFNYF